jgi:MoaA/NifB/PqqE/SkfB family radical SAM enzyme
MTALPILQNAVVVDTLVGPVPPWPHQALVEWQVLGHCNYDCSYCVQAKRHRVGIPSAAQLSSSLAWLSSLPGRWEIKTTGGEPFATKAFMDVVVPGIMATSHVMSTLTNLSAPVTVLQRFAAMTRGRLAVVSASLHQEFSTTTQFLSRLMALRDAVDDNTRIVVNSVLVPDRLSAVAEAKRDVEAAGFVFFPQVMKQKGGIAIYTPSQWREVEAIVGDIHKAGDKRSANLSPSYAGRGCYAGARYVVLTKDGDAWSCRTAKRFGEGHLGNVSTGISLHGGPRLCPYPICPCTTVANRGMIEGVPMRSRVWEDE